MGNVEYWYMDDAFGRAQSALRKAIGQFANRNRWMYIGLTQQQPEDRFGQHQRTWAQGHRWDRMIVIYHAKTFSLMQTVEDRLIQFAESQIQAGRYQCQLINDKNPQ